MSEMIETSYPKVGDLCPQCGLPMDVEAVTFWACEDLNNYDSADLTCTTCHIEWWLGEWTEQDNQ